MKNEQREKLVELIIQSVDGCARNWAETIADYLLKNNVVVLPCKVGQKVYIVDDYSNEFTGIDEGKITKVGWNGTLCSFRINLDYENFYETEFGKTVFLTKEEAEKELERSETE